MYQVLEALRSTCKLSCTVSNVRLQLVYPLPLPPPQKKTSKCLGGPLYSAHVCRKAELTLLYNWECRPYGEWRNKKFLRRRLRRSVAPTAIVFGILPISIIPCWADIRTSSSAIAERSHCRVGYFWPKLEDWNGETIFWGTLQVNLQPLWRNWSAKLSNSVTKTQNKGYYAVQGHSMSSRMVSIESPYATYY